MENITAQSFPENLPPQWKKHLESEKNQDYFKKLTHFLLNEFKLQQAIYPPRQWILRALQTVDYPSVKVVILGQDPYHGVGQAIGLSFGVPNDLLPKPPSLINIFKELESDIGIQVPPRQSDLTGWASQGVLLLNTVLTVRKGQAFSHREKGWELFTDRIIGLLNQRKKPVLFLLWGAAAQKKKTLITGPQHIILESTHPSPLSAYRGFIGSRPFSKINQILTQKLGLTAINWARITNETQ